MKFKVGDKVRVRSDLQRGDGTGRTIAVEQMLEYRNKIETIKEARKAVRGDYTVYTFEGDEYEWCWTDEMLEPVYTDEGIIGTFKGTPIYADGGVVSIHDLPIESLYRPMNIEIQPLELVCNEEQAKNIAERLAKELNGMLGVSFTKKEEKKMPTKFTFYTVEGYRMDKSNNTKIPTVTTEVVYKDKDGCATGGSATCDKADYDERQGCLEAIANAMCNGNFDREFNKAVKNNARADKKARTCAYCGQLFDTIAEKEAHEAWHVERRKARHERYLLRKRAKEIAFEEQAQKMAKEMIEK